MLNRISLAYSQPIQPQTRAFSAPTAPPPQSNTTPNQAQADQLNLVTLNKGITATAISFDTPVQPTTNTLQSSKGTQTIESPNGIYLAQIPENDFETSDNKLKITLEDQVVTVNTETPQSQLKEISWTPNNNLLAIEGFGAGTVTQGGDIYYIQAESGQKTQVLSAEDMAEDVMDLGIYYQYFSGHEARDLQIDSQGNVTYNIVMTDEMAENHFYVPMKAKLLDNGYLGERESASEFSRVQVGGDIAEGLNLSGIRTAMHNGHERVVLDIKAGGGYSGVPAFDPDSVGMYTMFQSVRPDGSADLYIELSGYRFQDYQDIPQPQYAKSIQPWALYDDSSLGLKVHLPKPGDYKVMALENPARLVIDLATGE